MINASARNYLLTIDGLDCTPALISMDGGFSHYESGSGIITINANLALRRTQGWTENLDDRVNNRWARGKVITFHVANSSNILVPAPVIGKLYILKSEYDGIRELKIEAGCILSLLNFRTPAGEGACFDLGETTSLNAIAAKLLQKAGVTAYTTTLTGAGLSIPLQKISNESYIQMFGKLCWSNGFIAYQDNSGIVRTQPVSLAPATLLSLTVGQDEISYTRLVGNEQPCEKIKVAGVKRTLQTTTLQQTVKENIGTLALVGINSTAPTVVERITEKAPVYDAQNRKVTQESYTEKMVGVLLPKDFPRKPDLVISEYKLETSYFEAPPSGEMVDCNQPDEGKLIRKEVQTLTPYGVTLAAFVENQDAAISPAVIVRNLLRLVESKTVTTYDYPAPRPINTSSTQIFTSQKITILEEKYEPQGILYNDDPNVSELEPAENPRRVQKVETVWQEVKPGEWWQSSLTSKALASASPEALELIKETLAPASVPIDTYFELLTTENALTKSNAGQAQPPSPERFPLEQFIKEDQLIGEATFPSYAGDSFRERERQYSVDSPFVTGIEQLRAIANIEGAIIQGRYKGQQCTIALHDELFSASPLQRINWAEPNGSTQAFLIDGLSVACAQNRFAMSFDCIWAGTVTAAILSGGTTTEVLAPAYTAYETRHNLIGGESHGGSLRLYEYELITTNHTLQGTETHGGDIAQDEALPITEFTFNGSEGESGNISLAITDRFTLGSGEGEGGSIAFIDRTQSFILTGGEGEGGHGSGIATDRFTLASSEGEGGNMGTNALTNDDALLAIILGIEPQWVGVEPLEFEIFN